MRDEYTPSGILLKLFYGLLAWFPCQFAFSAAWNALLEVPSELLFIGSLYGTAVLCAVIILCFPKKPAAQRENSLRRDWTGGLDTLSGAKLLAFFGAAAGLVRLWTILAFDNPPLSNYQEAHETAAALLAQGIGVLNPHPPTQIAFDATALYHTLYPSWGLYMLVLKNLYAIFGTSPYVGQYLNLVLTLAIMGMLYLLGVRFLKNPGLGLAAGILFAFWPPAIFYSMLHSPDHFTILLTGIILLLWAWSEEKRTAFLPHLLRMLLLGAALGILERFKTISLVLLAALAIYEGICRILPAFCGWLRERRKGFLRALSGGILTLGVLAVSMKLTVTGIDWAIGRNIGNVPQNLVGWFFYVGLTGEDGMWTPQKRDFRDELLAEYDYNIDAVNRELMKAVWEQVDTHTRATWKMLKEKAEVFWADDLDLYRCMYGRTMDHLYHTIKGSARVYYAGFLFLLFLGALGLFFTPSRREAARSPAHGSPTEGNPMQRTLFLAALVLFGSALMFLVSEMQIRYKFILAVPMSLLAGYGAEQAKALCLGGVSLLRQRISRGKAAREQDLLPESEEPLEIVLQKMPADAGSESSREGGQGRNDSLSNPLEKV